MLSSLPPVHYYYRLSLLHIEYVLVSPLALYPLALYPLHSTHWYYTSLAQVDEAPSSAGIPAHACAPAHLAHSVPGLTVVDKELCLATLAGIDACLHELGKFLPACKVWEEDAASIASTLPLGSPWEEDENAVRDADENAVRDADENVVRDADGNLVRNADEDVVRNADLNTVQYMDALMDDVLAAQDDALLKNREVEDVQKYLDAGFRALDRHDLGLKPCPKASACKSGTPKSKSAGSLKRVIRKAKKVSKEYPKALAKAATKSTPKASAKARAIAPKARAKAAAKASAKASAMKASVKARAKDAKKTRDDENTDKELSESDLKKKLHSESQL